MAPSSTVAVGFVRRLWYQARADGAPLLDAINDVPVALPPVTEHDRARLPRTRAAGREEQKRAPSHVAAELAGVRPEPAMIAWLNVFMSSGIFI